MIKPTVYHSYLCLNTSYNLSTLTLMQLHKLYTVTSIKLVYTYLARGISQLQNVQTGSGAHQASSSVGNGFPFCGSCGQGMKMITDLCTVPRLWISRVIWVHLLPVYAFIVQTWTTSLFLYILISQQNSINLTRVNSEILLIWHMRRAAQRPVLLLFTRNKFHQWNRQISETC
jgi:hypothetical protein